MRKVLLAAATLLALASTAACGGKDAAPTPAPEAPVKAFFAQSWDKGETADDYLAEVKPYLTPEALSSSKDIFGQQLDGQATIKYSNVKITDVADVNATTATVSVTYDVTYSYQDKSETQHQSDNITVKKIDGKWLLSD